MGSPPTHLSLVLRPTRRMLFRGRLMGVHLLLMGGMRSPPVPLAAPACWIVADVVLPSAAAATGDERGGRRPLLSPPSSSSYPSAAWLGVDRPDLAALVRHYATASHRASARSAAVGSTHLAVEMGFHGCPSSPSRSAHSSSPSRCPSPSLATAARRSLSVVGDACSPARSGRKRMDGEDDGAPKFGALALIKLLGQLREQSKGTKSGDPAVKKQKVSTFIPFVSSGAYFYCGQMGHKKIECPQLVGQLVGQMGEPRRDRIPAQSQAPVQGRG
ncbi:hypothetical protein ACLOJK_032209, partial [Asimina triloba]